MRSEGAFASQMKFIYIRFAKRHVEDAVPYTSLKEQKTHRLKKTGFRSFSTLLGFV